MKWIVLFFFLLGTSCNTGGKNKKNERELLVVRSTINDNQKMIDRYIKIKDTIDKMSVKAGISHSDSYDIANIDSLMQANKVLIVKEDSLMQILKKD